jgi:hypothetical protein
MSFLYDSIKEISLSEHVCQGKPLDVLYTKVQRVLDGGYKPACPRCTYSEEYFGSLNIICERCYCECCYICGKSLQDFVGEIQEHYQWNLHSAADSELCRKQIVDKWGDILSDNGNVMTGSSQKALERFHKELCWI